VVVAVVVVWMVKVARDDVIDVIPVVNGLVAAVRAVPVLAFVFSAIVVRRAISRIRLRDLDIAHS
jgi:hypothetical protein